MVTINGLSMLIGMVCMYAVYCIVRVWQCEVIPDIMENLAKLRRRMYYKKHKTNYYKTEVIFDEPDRY